MCSSTPSPINRCLLLLAFLGTTLAANAVNVTELWPARAVAPDAKTMAALDAAGSELPSSLKPALQFQRLVCQMTAQPTNGTWRADLERLARSTGEDTMTKAIREMARVWMARAQMRDIHAALRKHYTRYVRFPESLDGLKEPLPESLKTDPWGEPWQYSLQAPGSMPKLRDQRFQLTSSHLPAGGRTAVPAFKKVSMNQIGSTRRLILDNAIVDVGGTVSGCTLLHLADNWALLATQEQLFAVTF